MQAVCLMALDAGTSSSENEQFEMQQWKMFGTESGE